MMTVRCQCPRQPDVLTSSDLSDALTDTAIRRLREGADLALIHTPREPLTTAGWDQLAARLAPCPIHRIADDTPLERGHCYVLPCCAEYALENGRLRLLRFPFPEQRVHVAARLAPDTYQRLARDAAILSSLTDGVIVADTDGTIIEMNAAALQLHCLNSVQDARMTPEQYRVRFELSSVDGEPLPPEYWPISRVMRRECFNGLPFQFFDRVRGARRYLSFSGTPVFYDGDYRYAILTVRDITDSETAHQRLLESETAFKAAVDNFPSPFVIYDENRRVEFLNRAGTEALGVTLDQIRGKHCEEFQPREVASIYLPLLLRTYETGTMQQAELTVMGPGPQMEVQVTFVPIADGLGRVRRALGISRDLTGTHRAKKHIESLNQKLESQTAELRRTVSELESFSYAVAHDLLAPLRAMVGFSQVLRADYADALDEDGKEFARRIEEAGLRMSRLLDDILKLSRVSVQEFVREELDLAAITREVLRGLEVDVARYDIRLPDTSRDSGDAGLLRLALANLLSNAVKYSRQRSLPYIEVGVQEGPTRVYFVRDNGIGFESRDARTMFKPFHRFHDEKQFEGNGIGLAIVRRAIERHGGRVWAESAVGEGSTFYFTLRPEVGS